MSAGNLLPEQQICIHRQMVTVSSLILHTVVSAEGFVASIRSVPDQQERKKSYMSILFVGIYGS